MSDLVDCILESDMILYIHEERSSNIQNNGAWIIPYPSLNSPDI